jgi:hypothetical protein
MVGVPKKKKKCKTDSKTQAELDILRDTPEDNWNDTYGGTKDSER